MQTLLYHALTPEKIPNFEKIKRFLEAGDFRSAEVKKGLCCVIFRQTRLDNLRTKLGCQGIELFGGG
jgi:hypothetical protein